MTTNKVITRTISMSVKPARTGACALARGLLPVGNVIVAAFAVIRPDRIQVVIFHMLARRDVVVRRAPRVGRDVSLQIGAFPALRVSRLHHQILQGSWEETVIQFEGGQRRLERGDLRPRCGDASLLRSA